MIEHTLMSRRTWSSVYVTHVDNPELGAQVVLKIEERFGSKAVVTPVQLTKVQDFPKIGSKENKNLQDLGDLLLELMC